MADWRGYSNSRQMVEWSRVQDFTTCTLVFLPDAIWQIALKLLRTRAQWRTTYYDEIETERYSLPDQADFIAWVDEFNDNLEVSEMSCNSDFMTTLNGILAALQAANAQASACCAGQARFVSDGEGGYYYGTEYPGTAPTEFGGEGQFPTEVDFNNHKCLFANNLVGGMILTLNNISVMTAVNLFAGTLVVAWFVASPPIAVVLALYLAEMAANEFENLANAIEENRQEIVCAIYNANGAGQIIAFIDEQITEIIDDLGLGAFEQMILELMHSMLTTDVLNQAYQVIGLPPVSGYADCDECAPAPTCSWFASPNFPGCTFEEISPGVMRLTVDYEYEEGLFGGGIVYGESAEGPYCGFRLTEVNWVTAPTGVGAYADCAEEVTFPMEWPTDVTVIAVSVDSAIVNTGVIDFSYEPFDC